MTEAADVRTIDLDAHRAARAEKAGPAPRVVLEGHEYVLPRELPASLVLSLPELAAAQGKDPLTLATLVEPMLRALLGDTFDELVPKLDTDDLLFLLQSLLKMYQVRLPELSASGASS